MPTGAEHGVERAELGDERSRRAVRHRAVSVTVGARIDVHPCRPAFVDEHVGVADPPDIGGVFARERCGHDLSVAHLDHRVVGQLTDVQEPKGPQERCGPRHEGPVGGCAGNVYGHRLVESRERAGIHVIPVVVGEEDGGERRELADRQGRRGIVDAGRREPRVDQHVCAAQVGEERRVPEVRHASGRNLDTLWHRAHQGGSEGAGEHPPRHGVVSGDGLELVDRSPTGEGP